MKPQLSSQLDGPYVWGFLVHLFELYPRLLAALKYSSFS